MAISLDPIPKFDWRGLVLCLVAVVLIMVGGRWVFSGPDDGIVEDQIYDLAKTFPVNIEIGEDEDSGKKLYIAGQQFDFANRNLPKPSIVVPQKDDRGVVLVTEDTSLPPSTVMKSRVQVPERTIEDTLYPAYEYVEWRYHMTYRESVEHVPNVKPSK